VASGGLRTGATPDHSFAASGRPAGGFSRVSGVLDRFPDETGPVAEPRWWSHGSSDLPGRSPSARHSGDDRSGPSSWDPGAPGDVPGDAPRAHQPWSGHPSAPLPPRPPGVWDRLRPRADADHADDGQDEDTATVAQPRVAGRPAGGPANDTDDDTDDDGYDDGDAYVDGYDSGYDAGYDGRHDRGPSGAHSAPDAEDDPDEQTDALRLDPRAWEDQTGGLEVIGAHVEEAASRRRWWRRERHADRNARRSGAESEALDEGAGIAGHHDGHDDLHDDVIPIAPYDPRSGRRRRRRPVAVLISLVVLVGLVAGIVVGGEKLLTMINPSSRDFAGPGSGTVEIRISQGDTLSDIARTLVDGGVIGSIGPFIEAAEADPDATGIQPGVYRMRGEMSGRSAVDLLLDPAARLVSRVTLPEGLTVEATLAKLAETTGTPLAELEAAAAEPAALGLPAYAGGTVEGFLFPATYDFEPDTTPVDMLQQMIDRAVHALDELEIPADQRLTVVTKASLVQAEASTTEDMAKVARVLENRLADGMPLQLDTTVNYANGKSGITTTAADRSNPSPYNTYVHPGLPPGAIDNPGEDALRAVLAPAEGEWRFFVVVDPDTGDTRFAVTGEEHQQNVLLFQQWLRENPGG
jgi:uncharacterized YceG family protein